jgi:hypothetical protein
MSGPGDVGAERMGIKWGSVLGHKNLLWNSVVISSRKGLTGRPLAMEQLVCQSLFGSVLTIKQVVINCSATPF